MVIHFIKCSTAAQNLEKQIQPSLDAIQETNDIFLPNSPEIEEKVAEIQDIPAMPQPTIEEEWYYHRNDELYRLMKQYGDYQDDGVLFRVIDSFQIDPDGKKVAFTFDDGPYYPYTDQILDVLEKYHVRATFFVKGAYVEMPENDKRIRRELALGCEIGNHTMNHDNLAELSETEMRASIGGLCAIFQERYGYTMHLLRPPYISYGTKGSDIRNQIVSICKENELAIINHTRSSHDSYEEYTKEMIAERMLLEEDELGRGIDNSIFLFHDKYQHTVDSLELIIPVLIERGYQFVTVSELLQCSKEGLHYGWIYSKAD